MKTGLLLLVFLVVSLSGAESDLEALFNDGKFAETKALALKQLESKGNDEDLLFNGGLAAYLSTDYGTAASLWSRLKAIQGDDLVVRAKLIQAYEAEKSKDKRDREIAELLALRESGKDGKYKDNHFFTRDQFVVGDVKLMVFEYYALSGDRAMKWKFNIVNKQGDVESTISLGSYDSTNSFSQTVEKLPNGDRYYHLDGYYKNGTSHRTYCFYKGLPQYDDVKSEVINVLTGKTPAISGTDKDQP